MLGWCIVNHVFIDDATAIDLPFRNEPISWREWVTVRRLRRGWTKKDLAVRVGCSRTTLWRTVECAATHERFMSISQELRDRIDATLDAAEVTENVA